MDKDESFDHLFGRIGVGRGGRSQTFPCGRISAAPELRIFDPILSRGCARFPRLPAGYLPAAPSALWMEG